MKQLRKTEQETKQQIGKFSEADPEKIVEMEKKAEVWSKNMLKTFFSNNCNIYNDTLIQKYKDAINMWTDNIFAIQSWCKNKFSISIGDFNKQFNIPEDLDYKEWKSLPLSSLLNYIVTYLYFCTYHSTRIPFVTFTMSE